jgi:hypothetical protein
VSTRSRRSRARRFVQQPVQRDLPADVPALDEALRCPDCGQPAEPDPLRRDDLGAPQLWILHRPDCATAEHQQRLVEGGAA